jgi:predicted ribosome-associated RNA-binding protein Tma20
VEAPQVDQTALRESNPVIKAKQMGIKADDPKAAALANAFVEEKGLSADILSSAEGMKSFVDIFDIEDGQATQMRKMGVDMRNVEIGDSLGELVAAAGLLATANKNIKSGAVRVEDAADYAKKLVMNLGDSAKTFAKAAETGTPLDENFQNNLIKNADKAEEIGNVDFTDPMALKIVDLKAKFPEYSTAIDNNKEFAQQILDLVAVVGSVTGTDVFKPGVLELYLDPEIQDLGQQLDHGYLRLLVSDPDFFRNLLPILKSNTQLPSELFVELKNLNLTASELSKVLSDIQVGPKATPPGSPPSQVAQLTLQDEAGMLGLLDNRSFTGGVIDPVLFAASDQVLASVFFTETSDAYTALSDLDRSQHSDGAGDDFKELILGAKEISFSSGVYALDSASPVDFLVASSDKLTLTGNVIFNPSSADSGLILLSAGTVDLSGASSISFGGDELGIGSFDSLEVKNVDLKSEDQISLRSLDSIVINNSKMETSGKGADFVHLLAANELQVNNLRFSESVKRIAMEAMTINLSNVNFPSSSTVNLNSIYGGIDGKYPHFNSIQHGRVNFIEKIRYGSHLIMDRAAFDAHGGNITIGTSN